jgi:hypothetical protein
VGGIGVIRIAVTVLIAVQALMPPGICPCRFVPFLRDAEHPPREIAPEFLAQSADRACGSRAAERESEAPHRDPTEPCSDCPIVCTEATARFAILPATEHVPPETLPFVHPRLPLTTERAERSELRSTPPATPLFVRHCAFLM